MTETVAENQEQQVYADYWGVDERERYYFPDGVQYIEFKIMNEGDKVKFQKLTNQDIVLSRRDDSARMKIDAATERHTLIKTCVTGWNMYTKNQPVAYSPQMLEKWLQVAPPKLVEELEKAIRDANPWMLDEMEPEDIDKEIDRLLELKKQVIDRKAGETSSANK